MKVSMLLVEDDDNAVELFRRILRRVKAPGDCHVVHDGEEAVRYLTGWGKYADRESHPLPCLIVLDLLMPRMNGFEFLEWLRGHRKHREIPVFALTVCEESADRSRALGLGCKTYWIKSGQLRDYEAVGRRIATFLRQFCSRVRRRVADA